MPENTPAYVTLPRLPSVAEERLREEQPRGELAARLQIDEDAERTIVTGHGPTAVADAPELRPGSSLQVLREVTGSGKARLVEEAFIIKEALSSEHNIAGDVFRAGRYWDGQFYGDVVLKKPKSSLRGQPLEYLRVCRDLEREQRCLFRFERHPSLLSPTGPPFQWEGELVLQTQYLPWSITEYLTYFSDEISVTTALGALACETLSAIEHMAGIRDEEGPCGYAHVDLKATHLRMDHRERADGRVEWIVVMIDLDSVLPIGSVRLDEAKYNRACVDPEKFMALHDQTQLVTVEAGETVYALGLTLLRVLAEGLGVLLERRRVQPVGLFPGREGALLVDGDALHREIVRARGVDRRNLGTVYWANRQRRLEAGRSDEVLPELERIIDEESSEPHLVPSGSPSGWTVRPDFFLGLQECLQARSERLDARRLRALFARLIPR